MPHKRLAEAFARAPLSEDGWDNALRALAEATGSAHGQLLAVGKQHLSFNWANDVPESFVAELDRIDGYNPQVNYRVGTVRAPLEVSWEVHYDALRARHTDEAYLETVRRLDVEHGAQMVLANKPGAFFGLAILRGEAQGRTTEAEREILSRVGPEVLAAIRLQDSIEHQGARLLQGSLDTVRSAAILIDGMAQVCHVTQAAQAMLGPDLMQVRAGTLRATRPDLDRQLQARIGLALRGGDTGPADLWMRSEAGLVLTDVRALPHEKWNMGFSPRVIVTLRSPIATEALAREDAQGQLLAKADQLCAALDLTAAEAQVVALLAIGHPRSEVAVRRGVSVQTVASQLRTIFVKCGVNRESELMVMARAVLETAAH